MYQRKDGYYTRAKSAGYRSRAAFKLLELAEKARLFHPGDCVVDLGAWPGGWLQVASRSVGPTGKVVGVDRQAIAPLSLDNVILLVGDITDARTQERVAEACGGKADVLLSDLAPKLSGIRARDQAHAAALAECVMQCAGRLLRPGGTLVVKLFMDAELGRHLTRLRRDFREVRTTRPAASRKGSAELYAVASGLRSGDALPSSA